MSVSPKSKRKAEAVADAEWEESRKKLKLNDSFSELRLTTQSFPKDGVQEDKDMKDDVSEARSKYTVIVNSLDEDEEEVDKSNYVVAIPEPIDPALAKIAREILDESRSRQVVLYRKPEEVIRLSIANNDALVREPSSIDETDEDEMELD